MIRPRLPYGSTRCLVVDDVWKGLCNTTAMNDRVTHTWTVVFMPGLRTSMALGVYSKSFRKPVVVCPVET